MVVSTKAFPFIGAPRILTRSFDYSIPAAPNTRCGEPTKQIDTLRSPRSETYPSRILLRQIRWILNCVQWVGGRSMRHVVNRLLDLLAMFPRRPTRRKHLFNHIWRTVLPQAVNAEALISNRENIAVSKETMCFSDQTKNVEDASTTLRNASPLLE